MVVFLLFSKIFLVNCSVNLKFSKLKKLQTNLLKAPSRHKKFFHQIFFEIFLIKVFIFFPSTENILLFNTPIIFNKLQHIFKKIGSNTLTRTKFSTCIPFNAIPIYELL